MATARGDAYASFDRSVDVHVSNLRRKLATIPASPQMIKHRARRGLPRSARCDRLTMRLRLRVFVGLVGTLLVTMLAAWVLALAVFRPLVGELNAERVAMAVHRAEARRATPDSKPSRPVPVRRSRSGGADRRSDSGGQTRGPKYRNGTVARC